MKKNLNAIEFRDVCMAFGDRVILNHVSFNVRYGESKLVLGGSGTGKSTICRLVLGLLKPDAGQIFVDGEEITGLSEEQIAIGLAGAHGPDMRLELQEAGGVTILNDAYNANPASMRAALDTAAGLSCSGRRIAVLGDMLELGKSAERFHREIGELVATLPFYFVVCIGPNSRLMYETAIAKGVDPQRIRHHADSAAAAREMTG